MHLAGIEAMASDLKLLEDHLKMSAMTQTVAAKISYVASYKSMLAICYVGGTINFIDFALKTETPVSNLLASVRIIRRSSSSTLSRWLTRKQLQNIS